MITKYRVVKEGLGVPIGQEIKGRGNFYSAFDGKTTYAFDRLHISLALKAGVIEEVFEGHFLEEYTNKLNELADAINHLRSK